MIPNSHPKNIDNNIEVLLYHILNYNIGITISYHL